MSVEIIHDRQRHIAAMIDNTTMQAFGPVFTGPGCDEDAEDFLDWLDRNPQPIYASIANIATGSDPRQFSDDALEAAHERWQNAADARRGVEDEPREQPHAMLNNIGHYPQRKKEDA